MHAGQFPIPVLPLSKSRIHPDLIFHRQLLVEMENTISSLSPSTRIILFLQIAKEVDPRAEPQHLECAMHQPRSALRELRGALVSDSDNMEWPWMPPCRLFTQDSHLSATSRLPLLTARVPPAAGASRSPDTPFQWLDSTMVGTFFFSFHKLT